jgi:hypothetical protein
MKYKQIKGNEIQGELGIFISHNEEENNFVNSVGSEVLIHGNPEELKSFAKLFLEIAELNQEEVDDKYLPIGAREHYHLRRGIELSKRSVQLILGRLDAKVTSHLYERFIPKK